MTNPPYIVVVNAGSISGDDMQRLRDAGYVVVQNAAGDIHDCLRVVSGVSLPIDPLGLVNAAFWAVGQHKHTTDAFGVRVQRLCQAATAPESKP